MESITTRSGRALIAVHDWVICKEVKDEIVSPGGIVIADHDAAESNQKELEVVAVGPVAPSGLVIGDRVKIVGQAPAFLCDGVSYRMVRDGLIGPGDMRFEMRQVGEQILSLPVGPPFIVSVIRTGKGDA